MSDDAENPDAGGHDPPLTVGSSPQELLGLAEDKAHHGGALLLEWFHHGFPKYDKKEGEENETAAVASKSSPTDLVSWADIEVERQLRESLQCRRPHDSFLGEESGERQGTSGLTWVVDPLDGTVNYLFGIPHWCVSVAVRDRDGVLAGAIFDPVRNELFTATRDGPALLKTPEKPRLFGPPPHRSSYDRHTLKGRRCESLATAMVATGFAYDTRVRAKQAEAIGHVLPRVRDIRRFGSAALDLAWTAAGRYDAYFERTVKPWDIAAGVLVCARAGLTVRELPPAPGLPGGVLAAPGSLAPELLALVG